jgi:hypothetical protein
MISASKPAISVILADSNTFVPSDLSEGIERAPRLLLVAFSGKVDVYTVEMVVLQTEDATGLKGELESSAPSRSLWGCKT